MDVQDETGETPAVRKAGPKRAAGRARVAPDTRDLMDVVPPTAAPTIMRRRHRVTLITLLLFVVLPFVALAGYLTGYAQDQCGSEAGFSVRKEEGPSGVQEIGGLTALTGAASTDAEILYDFIRSQDLVMQLDQDLGLESIYSRNYDADPLMSLKPGSPVEDKVDYWRRMITIEYNEATGLIRLEVRAFTPEEAQRVGQAILDKSTAMINRLSESAREDATRYARTELDRAVERLKDVREAITEYRSRTQLVDPLADIQGQMGVMNTLQGQLAEALIDLDILNDFAKANDPRKAQIERRIEVINKRLAEERAKFSIGSSTSDGDDYATIVAEYERLVVDRQVAEEAFRSATLILDTAQAEAQRQSRYLAAHVQPTLAEAPQYPRVALILLISGFFLLLGWAMLILVYYSIRDRR